MKKSLEIVVLCCALMLMLGLAGCGGSNSSASASASSASSSTASTSSSSDNPANSASASSASSSTAPASSSSNESSSSAPASASSASTSASSSSDEEAKAEYDRACALYDEGKFYSAKEAFEKSAYSDWEQRAAACVQPMPETGELFHDPDMTSDNMILNFTVEEKNDNEGTYILVYTRDKKLVETLFIKGTGTVETWLPGGEYYVKDSTGTEWYGTDEQFGPDGYYESMVFNGIEDDPYLTVLEEGYEWDITINTTVDTGRDIGSEAGSWDNRG